MIGQAQSGLWKPSVGSLYHASGYLTNCIPSCGLRGYRFPAAKGLVLGKESRFVIENDWLKRHCVQENRSSHPSP